MGWQPSRQTSQVWKKKVGLELSAIRVGAVDFNFWEKVLEIYLALHGMVTSQAKHSRSWRNRGHRTVCYLREVKGEVSYPRGTLSFARLDTCDKIFVQIFNMWTWVVVCVLNNETIIMTVKMGCHGFVYRLRHIYIPGCDTSLFSSFSFGLSSSIRNPLQVLFSLLFWMSNDRNVLFSLLFSICRFLLVCTF